MARATSPAAHPIRFRGTPAALAAVVVDELARQSPMVLRLKLGKPERAPLEVMVQTDFDPRILRASLPADVPPGAYGGVLQSNGTAREVQVEVDSAPRLHVVPEQLRIQAHPGDMVGADLTILNQGNVPVQIRAVQAVGIFQSGGIERALRRAYVLKLARGERRMDAIADGLAEAHGGLVRMKVDQGSGEIAPGEIRELHLILHVPRELEAGALYSGTWELPGLVYPVNVQVAGEEAPPDEGEDDGAQPPREASEGGSPQGGGRKPGGGTKPASGGQRGGGRGAGQSPKPAPRRRGAK
jgi:hypothetical protein